MLSGVLNSDKAINMNIAIRRAFVEVRRVLLRQTDLKKQLKETNEDVREMIIQHILTEDVFNTIFDENQLHRENNIARGLESVIHTFFTGSTRKIALASIQHYYQAINAAAGIADQLFSNDKVYEQLYSKHFKKFYAGKPTKRYLN